MPPTAAPPALLHGVAIGAGYFSSFHLDAWSRIPEVRITALADLDLDRAKQVAARFGIPRVYSDYREMLERERPDFVDVIVPPAGHLPICTHAAQRGIHVICQKPLTTSLADAQCLVDRTEAAGVRFMVHENWRWQPWYRELRSLRDRGVLGEIFSAHFCMRTGDGWQPDAYLARQPYFRTYPHLLMFETGVHFIDAFRFLLGEVVSVSARLRRLNSQIIGEDSGHVLLGFESGATAVLDANRYNEGETDDDPRYTFGTLRLDASRGHARLCPDGRLLIKPLGQPTYEHAYHHVDRGLGGDSCHSLQTHFVERFLTGQPFESEGRDYLRTLQVVDACYVSAAEGRTVLLGEEQAPARREILEVA